MFQCLQTNTEILEFTQYKKSNMTSSIIYADLESLIKRTENYSPENQVNIHHAGIRCLLYEHLMLQKIILYEKICQYLREDARKIINFEKKKMISLRKEQQDSHEKQKSATFVEIFFNINALIIKSMTSLTTILIIY